MRFWYFLLLLLVSSCNSATYYIVRHAEKEKPTMNMSSDLPLSETGAERAWALKEQLQSKFIRGVFSTNTIRTKATAKPLSEYKKVPVISYDAKDSSFINLLKGLSRGHYLIVGHSNTVDDLVNGLMNKEILTDLEDSAYGDLFMVKRSGKKMHFRKGHFGK